MIVTEEFLESGMSEKGGWTKKQVQALGYKTWFKGWKRECIGKYISEEDARKFIILKTLPKIPGRMEILQKTVDSEFIESGDIPLKDQYIHPLWQKRRLEIMQRDRFHCMACGSKTKTLHVHHNTYDGKYLWLCRHDSMITVCYECHEKIHGRKLG